MKRLSPTEERVLQWIAQEGPIHGMGIVHRFQVKRGTVYGCLATLRLQHFVEYSIAPPEEGEGGPDRCMFTITEEGKRALTRARLAKDGDLRERNLLRLIAESAELLEVLDQRTGEEWRRKKELGHLLERCRAILQGTEFEPKGREDAADIHTKTASRLFGIVPQAVSPKQRRVAKDVNFAQLYGGVRPLPGGGPPPTEKELEAARKFREHIRVPAPNDPVLFGQHVQTAMALLSHAGDLEPLLHIFRLLPGLEGRAIDPYLRGEVSVLYHMAEHALIEMGLLSPREGRT